MRPFEIATDRVARPFRDAYNWFDGLITARSEKPEAEVEVQDLRHPLHAAESSLQENVRLKQLLQYQTGPSFPTDFHAVNAESPLAHRRTCSSRSSSPPARTRASAGTIRS